MKYFDYTATTPVDIDVLDTYIKTTQNFFANTSSLHKLGQRSNLMYNNAVEQLCSTLKLNNYNVIFTSNATEANNLSIFGICEKYSKGKIITTKIEHPSVFEVFKSLENRFDIVYLDINEEGIIDINELKKEMTNDIILVSIMWVNNIIGTIQPIKEIIDILKLYPKTKLHVDMVQGLCKIVPDFNLNDIDLMTFSTHKIYGPKGIGGIFLKKSITLNKRLYGSNIQMGVKPGTIDLALICATVKAFKKFYPETLNHYNDVKEKHNYLLKQINNKNIIINTPVNNISYYILNISVPNINGETIVHMLEQKEIYVSTGSACSSKLKKPEKTIFALTKSEKLATTSIRISLSHLTTYDELNELINVLNSI